MNRESSRIRLSGLVPLLLFAVLAAAVLTVLMTGAEQYGRLTERDQSTFVTRTAGQYVRTKLRQAGGEIGVDTFNGSPAVAMRESLNDFACVTWLYCYDGYLRELFALEGEVMSPDAGEKLLEMEALDAAMTDGMLTITLTDSEGGVQTILYHPESGANPW